MGNRMIDVKFRLERWADFSRIAPDFGLGYPKQTVENRITFGGSGHVIEIPEDVQNTEKAVRVLIKDKLDVVRLYYIRRCKIKQIEGLLTKEHGKRRSRAWVYQTLDSAEQQILGFLLAIE